jgi:hypothetical protein
VRNSRVYISVFSDNDNCPLDLEPDRVRDHRTLVHRHCSSCSNRLSPSYSFPPCISPTLSLLPYLPLTLLSSNAYPNSFRPVSLARTDPSSFPFSQTQDSIPRTPYSSFQAANFQRNRHQCVFLTVDFFLFAPPRDFPPILSRFFPSPSLFFFPFPSSPPSDPIISLVIPQTRPSRSVSSLPQIRSSHVFPPPTQSYPNTNGQPSYVRISPIHLPFSSLVCPSFTL